MLVGFEANAGRRARLEPVGHEGRGDTSTRATMGFIANGRDQQVRFFADLLARGGNGIGPRRQRAGERCELLGREGHGKGFDKIDQLASLNPGAGLPLVKELAHLRMPRLSGKGFEGLDGEGRDVPLSWSARRARYRSPCSPVAARTASTRAGSFSGKSSSESPGS